MGIWVWKERERDCEELARVTTGARDSAILRAKPRLETQSRADVELELEAVWSRVASSSGEPSLSLRRTSTDERAHPRDGGWSAFLQVC